MSTSPSVIPPKRPALARQAERESALDLATSAAVDALRVIKTAFDAGEVDFDDACRALPLVHKVLEHVDRIDVARNASVSLAPMVFTLVLDDSIPQEPPPKRARPLPHALAQPDSVVTEVDIKEPQTQRPT